MVLPGLGAFVAQRCPASIDATGCTLYPPTRSLGFNAAITHDDGLLLSSIARRDNLTYEEARSHLANFVDLLRSRLQVEHAVEFPRVGTLSLEGPLLQFSPSADIVSAPLAGLPALTITPLQSQAGDTQDTSAIILTRRHRLMRSVGRYAAAVVVLAAMGLTLSTPVVVDRLTTAKASLELNISAPKKAVIPASSVVEESEPIKQQPQSITLLVPAPKVVEVADIKEGADYSCYIIVASCSSQAQAQRFISASHAQDSMKVLKSDGRYRVYTAVSNDYDAAYAYKSTPTFSAAHPGAWVYQP